MILVDLGVFVVALLALVKLSGLTVDEVVKFSEYLGISLLTVGFLLIALSTALPDLAVSLVASSLEELPLSVGTVIGANIAKILLIFGLISFGTTIKIGKDQWKKSKIFLGFTSFISFLILALSDLGRDLGLLLFMLFFLLSYLFLKETGPREREVRKGIQIKNILLLLLGLSGIVVSSYFVVYSANNIALFFDLSKTFIGATVLAIGTSLPELSTSVMAVRKRKYSLAIGVLVGSCVINLTFVLGLALMTTSILITSIPHVLFLIAYLNVANVAFLFLARDRVIWALDSLVFLSLYILFVLISSGVLFVELLV